MTKYNRGKNCGYTLTCSTTVVESLCMHLQNFSVKLLSVDNMKHSKIREATFNPMQGSNFFIITGTEGYSSLTTLITVIL